MADKYLCRACSKPVTATKNDRYRSHTDGTGESCEMSSEPIPEDLLAQPPSNSDPGVPEEGKDFARCPQCERNVKLTRLGYFEPHDTTLRGGERCQTGGVRAFHAGVPKDVPLPGDKVPEGGVYQASRPKVSAQMEVEGRAPTVTARTEPAASGPPVADAASASGAALPSTSELEEPARTNLLRQPMSVTEDLWAGMELAPDATSGASMETSSPESGTTSKVSSGPLTVPPSPGNPTGALTGEESPPSTGPFALGIRISDRILQPFSPYLQPIPYEGPDKPEPMGDLAKELATRIRETFYSYDNRRSSDNRGAQKTLGPSEIGTPCDRRLAMTLMGIPAVNEGGDGWAAFVGTCGHEGMAAIFKFADAGTGRYAVELPVRTGSEVVPHGTTDLLDRRDGTIIDWKFMGDYSLKKFRLEGPSDTYRVQAHTYGLAAALGGEKVRNVAIVGLPRAGGSLDDMHVWTDKFDRKLAEEALKRVEGIAAKVQASNTEAGLDVQEHDMRVARRFPTANDCRYCPFHLKNDKEMRRGCPGF